MLAKADTQAGDQPALHWRIDMKADWGKKLHAAGEQSAARGESLSSAICELGGSWAEMKAFELGYQGQPWEVQTYERFGMVPNGPSRNHADDSQESGVSVISDDWMRTLSAQFIATRERVSFRGVNTGNRGSDGEPLVLPVDIEKHRPTGYTA